MEYGQFCPIAKAFEVVGEKWTALIIREVLMGSRRFSELQRGLGSISPTLLSRRLNELENHGIIYKKSITGQRTHEYYPTESCKELLPILLTIGDWGMKWARSNLRTEEYDVELLMLYLQRSIRPENLPDTETIIRFSFTDMTEKGNWWIISNEGEVDICDKDPGKDVDVYFSTTVPIMTDVWMGKSTYRKASKNKEISIVGNDYLVNNVSVWMENCVFSELPSAENIL
ncbi:HxlR family transcriptional regulator [Kiloniella spongiae]|uniref:HxlR family transcriptional regulator n=1 Tax=Kiloniella spongiae TaxID=1489064 RepID=A0A0H2MJ49_9PROT|nr:helix-turn-helix domain-containing protein [Kiloniella spongiae]KLN60782.1 HxlR family transcriptional regulator [Kiloniella spongiae]